MKMIIVDGEKSSGKTSAILLATKMLGIDYGENRISDVLTISRIKVGRNIRMAGIASSGDSAAIIRDNISFFQNHNLDFIVFACSLPKGMLLLKAFALLRDAEIIPVKTEKLNSQKKREIKLQVDTNAKTIVKAFN